MPQVKLTDKFIRSSKCPAGEQQIDFFDTGVTGLTLRITKFGRKVFTLRYRIAGKQKRFKLGDFGDHPNHLLLRDARVKAAEVLVAIEKGDDPALERTNQRSVEKAPNTVADGIDVYINRLKRRGRRESYLYDITKRLHLHVTPIIGHMEISSVTSADIAKIFRPLEADGKITTHNRVLTMLRPVFKLAKVEDPTKEFEKLPEQPKEEWFSLEDLAKIWIALDDPETKAHPMTVLAIRLAMLTLKRGGEVASAQTNEVKENLWHIPSSRMKGKRPEVVPLSKPALDIIDTTMNHHLRRSDCLDYIFSSRTKSNQPIERNAMSRAFPRARRLVGLGDHAGSLHSLRHSGATILASRGTSPYVVSALLSHSLSSAGVSQVTSRYNMYDLLEERRAALAIWGDLLMSEIERQKCLQPQNSEAA